MTGSRIAETYRARYVFRVKEHARREGDTRAQPWLAAEPHSGNLEVLEDGILGFDLPEGTTYERAKEIARFMNENLKEMSFTHIAPELDDRQE